jgi:hypothetical protein
MVKLVTNKDYNVRLEISISKIFDDQLISQ